MSNLEIQFSEADKQQFSNEMRQRPSSQAQKVGYDEEEMRTLQSKTHNVTRDRRVVFTDVPSLGKWALDKETGGPSIMTKRRVTKFVHEILGTMWFVFFVVLSVFVKTDITQFPIAPDVFIFWGLSIQSLYVGFVQAFGLSLALVTSGYWSADFNSTYTFWTSFFPRPADSDGNKWTFFGGFLTGLIKILGQHIGAFLGALMAWAVLGTSYPGASFSSTVLGFPGLPGSPLGFGFVGETIYLPTVGQAFLFEMFGAMLIGLVMMMIQFNPPSALTKMPQLTLPFVLLALVTAGCPITGAVFNWARYFGQAIVALIAGGSFGPLWWLYLLAPLAGHLLAAILFVFAYNF